MTAKVVSPGASVTIYALADPRDGRKYYVGSTADTAVEPSQRYCYMTYGFPWIG